MLSVPVIAMIKEFNIMVTIKHKIKEQNKSAIFCENFTFLFCIYVCIFQIIKNDDKNNKNS